MGKPFCRGTNRTGVRSNACTISTMPTRHDGALFEQVFDFVSPGAYLSNTCAGWIGGLTFGPAPLLAGDQKKGPPWPAPFTNCPTQRPMTLG